MSGVPLIEFRNVSKRFGDKIVLDRASFSLYPGEVTSLIGKSGVGKSVTLKLIIGLLKPDLGEIFFQGRSIAAMDRREKKLMKAKVNFMFQQNALFDSLSIFENIALPLEETTALKKDQISEKVQERMEVLELTGVEGKYPSQLSGGMQKRVALARALITDPEVVLFDEPTTGLDPIRKKHVLTMITNNQKNYGFSAVLVSHDVPDVFYISNRVIIIEDGQIMFQGSPIDLEQSENDVVDEFVSSRESLRNEIIGLKSRQSMERIYARATNSSLFQHEFAVITLQVQNFERIIDDVGELAAQKIMVTLADLSRRHLALPDNILGRFEQNTIMCVLPRSSLDRARTIVQNIARELRNKSFMQQSTYPRSCVNFSITAGMSTGNIQQDLADLMQSAQKESRVLASLICGGTDQ
jgi:phospholipid/cholesterol/gamma-HCH transport system ATP-binding protein